MILPPRTRPAVAALAIGVIALAVWNKVAAPPETAPPPPANARPAEEPPRADRARPAMTEEERSARNEQMFGQIEMQKKTMGMTLLGKSEAAAPASRRPPAPALAAPVPTLLSDARPAEAIAAARSAPASGLGRPAPDAALVFTDASGLESAWILLGLPGSPPAADFANGRLVLIKPSATKILSVEPGRDAVTIVYRSLLPEETPDPARDRAAPLPAAPKAVMIYDASPR